MDECTNPKVGSMLHAYELGLLDDSDRRAVELHLMECHACFEKLTSFLPAAAILRRDQPVKDQVALAARETDDSEMSVTAGQAEKPRQWTGRWYAWAAAAAAVILVSIGVSRFSSDWRESSSDRQSITLVSTRSTIPTQVEITRGGYLYIRYQIETPPRGLPYEVSIIGAGGDTVLVAEPVGAIDSLGFGSLEFPVAEFQPGLYRLRVMVSSDTLLIREHIFRVR